MAKNSASPADVIKTWVIRLIMLALILLPAMYFPKVVGALFGTLIVLVIGVCVLWFVIKKKLKQAFGSVGNNMLGMTAFTSVLTLLPADDDPSEDSDKVAQTVEDLESMGFTDRAAYTAEDVPKMRLISLIHPEKNVVAVIYSCTSDVELVSKHGEESFLSYTNAEHGKLRCKIAEDIPVVFCRDMDPSELFENFNSHVMPKPRIAVSATEFVSFYKRFQEEHESRKSAADEAARKLDEELQNSFFESSGWTVMEWDQKRERVSFVHDEMGEKSVSALYLYLFDWDGKLGEKEYERREKLAAQKVQEMTPREAFASLIVESNMGDKVEKILELAQPLPTDVYLSPANDEHEGE